MKLAAIAIAVFDLLQSTLLALSAPLAARDDLL